MKFFVYVWNIIIIFEEPEDESIIKLSKYLGERNLRLIDFLKIMDRSNALEISVDEFLRRIKVVKFYFFE